MSLSPITRTPDNGVSIPALPAEMELTRISKESPGLNAASQEQSSYLWYGKELGLSHLSADVRNGIEQNVGDEGGRTCKVQVRGQPDLTLVESGGCNKYCPKLKERYTDGDRLQASIAISNESSNKHSNRSDSVVSDPSCDDRACANVNVCNKKPLFNDLIYKGAVTDDEGCLDVSTEVVDEHCANQSTENDRNTIVNDDNARNNEVKEWTSETTELIKKENEECQNTTDHSNIHNFDESQNESLLTKMTPGQSPRSDIRYAEALARREEMVKDLGVDGSGLKVMCCMLTVILIFACVIIIIAVVGL
ncbi:uncharacterized protein [Argopecten irradians]|uniref:uncharacterized protein n=1 Tax=Argopecten irradians TaxID=31199 RepID=UPI00370FDA1E